MVFHLLVQNITISKFTVKTRLENIAFAKKYHNTPLNWMAFHLLVRNISISKFTVKTRLRNTAFALNKKMRKLILFADNSPKKNWQPKI